MTVEFEANEFLTLKLEEGKTNIYIKGELFDLYCEPKIMVIPKESVEDHDDINAIDEVNAVEVSPKDIDVDPETIFWGHCSNMQSWIESEYDTRILYYNLSIPLLKRLSESGDLLATKAYKREVTERFVDGSMAVKKFLIIERHVSVFNAEEFNSLIDVLDDTEEGKQAEFWNSIGHAFYQTRAYEIAIQMFERAVKLGPEYVTPVVNIGTNYLGLGDGDKAEGYYLRALGIKSDSVPSFAGLSLIYQSRGQIEKATECINKVLSLDIEAVIEFNGKDAVTDALKNLGSAAKNMGEFEKALAVYEKGLRYIPENRMLHRKKGFVLYRLGRLDEVVDHLDELIAMDTDDKIQLMISKARILGDKYQIKEGKKLAFEIIQQLKEDGVESNAEISMDILYELARLHYIGKEYESAEELSKMLLDHSKKDWRSYLLLILLYAELGRCEEAKETFLELIHYHPKCNRLIQFSRIIYNLEHNKEKLMDLRFRVQLSMI